MSSRKRLRRQIFVLTPDEKRAACCIIGAFLLGLVTMYYRAKHPRTLPPPELEQHASKNAAKVRQPFAASPTPPSAPSEEEDE